MFGVSSVYRDGGVRGRAKYQISEDEKCQNPFAGNPATLPAPDQTLGSKQMRASPSGGVINLSLVMQYIIAMSDRWSPPATHHQN